MTDFVYLYGFVPADAPAPQDLAGVAGSAVTLVATNSVSAAVSYVPAAEYAPDQVEARLKNLQWVAEQGVAHERVVAWFVDNTQILPAPLFTMYSSTDALREATAQRDAELAKEMQRLRGLREWDLKISFDEQELQEHGAEISNKLAQLDQEIAAAPAGKGYLLQKKRADLLKTEVRQAAHQRAVDVLNSAHPLTADTRTLPLPRTVETLPVVLHAALLVRIENETRLVQQLEAEAQTLRAIGMDLNFSGPWAPYRFMGEHEH
ncbi:MAG TPA: GvpL/GvpF family gas vesicle protein [Longimicrobiales bacterium]